MAFSHATATTGISPPGFRFPLSFTPLRRFPTLPPQRVFHRRGRQHQIVCCHADRPPRVPLFRVSAGLPGCDIGYVLLLCIWCFVSYCVVSGTFWLTDGVVRAGRDRVRLALCER